MPIVQAMPIVSGMSFDRQSDAGACTRGPEVHAHIHGLDEHQEAQSRTPQVPALAVDDVAEGMHRSAVRSQPRRMPGGVGDRDRQGANTGVAGALDWSGVFRQSWW